VIEIFGICLLAEELVNRKTMCFTYKINLSQSFHFIANDLKIFHFYLE